ncbi:MAG: alpha/beta fold hydrolase [Planctomycetes bacterium]|nr:alpha/beta fold hydrolase [Planctomycetota bacterium]
MQSIELSVPVVPPLGANLLVPPGARAAALFIQGSGVHDRDGSMPAVGFQSTLYRRVARELAQRCALAGLRYDKRGHDLPAPGPQDYTIESRLADAAAALALLRSRPECSGLPLFLLGHSEGALVAAKLAEREAVRGVVCLAAPWGNVFELNRDRARRLLANAGTRERGERAVAFHDILERLFREGSRILPEQFVELAQPYFGTGYQGWESFEWLAGHWAGALQSDPTGKGTPMLVVQGGRDARLWDDNAQRWQQWCAGRPLARYHLVAHMGHDLNDARQKTFRVDDAVLDLICGFVRELA